MNNSDFLKSKELKEFQWLETGRMKDELNILDKVGLLL